MERPRRHLAGKNILVPTDLSERENEAVNHAVALAEHFGAKLTVLYVDTLPDLDAYFGGLYAYPALRRHRADNLEALDELGRQIKSRYANSETYFRCGNFCEEIVRAAIALDADLIVFSTSDYKRINRLPGHSDAEDVLRPAPCPVLSERVTRITLPFISNLLLLFLWLGPLPSQLGLQSSVVLGQVEKLPRGKPLARSGDGIPQSYLAISKDLHGPPRVRHRDIKLCLVRLAERPNRQLAMTWSTVFAWLA